MPGAGRLGPARDRLTLRPRRADPLPPDRQAITKLHRRLDVEAIDITNGRTDRAAAVPRLVQLVPPARVDLVDEVLSRVGRKSSSAMGWPPYMLVCELARAVKAVHLGVERMRRPNGWWWT